MIDDLYLSLLFFAKVFETGMKILTPICDRLVLLVKDQWIAHVSCKQNKEEM